MTKRLSEILAEARQVVSVEEQIEDYLNFLSTLTEEEIEEEIEALDELSKKKLMKYASKSIKDARYYANDYMRDGDDVLIRGKDQVRRDAQLWNTMKKSDRTSLTLARQRVKGVSLAAKKIAGKAKTNANEEVESISELSKAKLANYVTKSAEHMLQHTYNSYDTDPGARDRDESEKLERGYAKTKRTPYSIGSQRLKGTQLALKKLAGKRVKVNASEEVESIDELSKKTLGSYTKKATTDLAARSVNLGLNVAHSTSNKLEGKPTEYQDKNIQHNAVKMSKRLAGISRSLNKLAREETETLNLGGYQPVPGAEKDFVSKHKVQKHADPAGNGDDVFKGSNIKKTKHTPNEKIKEDITEAKAVSPTLAAKRALQGVADSVGRNKEGHLVARREFFYRHGGTSEKFAGEVSRALTKAGVKHTVVDHNEHWAPFRGGASVKSSSHWAAHIKVHDGE